MISWGKNADWLGHLNQVCIAYLKHFQGERLFLREDCLVPYPYELMDQPETSQAMVRPDQDVLSLTMLQQQNWNCLVGLTTTLKSLMGGAVRTTINQQNQSCRLYLQDCHCEPWEGTSNAASSKVCACMCVGGHTHTAIQGFLLKGTSASGIWCS